eukprot:7790407-Lingulodinium_polyedra.AAC.1
MAALLGSARSRRRRARQKRVYVRRCAGDTVFFVKKLAPGIERASGNNAIYRIGGVFTVRRRRPE